MRLALCLLAIILFLSSCSATRVTPKNLIVLLADDMGYSDISPYNPLIRHTPNLQWLADNGSVLTEFYTPVSVCTPGRAALLTGQHPAAFDEAGLLTVIKTPKPGLDLGDQTLAGQLRIKGYHTGIIGKWHLGDVGPLANGFDYAFYLPYGLSANNLELWENETFIETYPDFTAINDRFLGKAVEFIDASPGPFFLYVGHIWPHVPLLNNQRPGLSYYQSAIAEIDDLAGGLLDHLRAIGRLETTVIMVTSDNGPRQADQLDEAGLPVTGWTPYTPLANKGIYPDAMNPERWAGGAQPFKQAVYDAEGHLLESTAKGTTWEGGVRVPFLIYGLPLEDRPLGMTDIYDLSLGADTPQHDVFHFYNGNRTYGAIRQGNWKLHLDETFQPVGLYDLAADAGEAHDLAGLYPDLAADLAYQALRFDALLRGRAIWLPVFQK